MTSRASSSTPGHNALEPTSKTGLGVSARASRYFFRFFGSGMFSTVAVLLRRRASFTGMN
jgi:hypothetical protein